MNISIKQVSSDEKEILRNLLEKYNFEFSKWDKRDVNALGLYGYDWFDHYWTEDDRYAFFIMADEKLAGFAMINSYCELTEDIDYSMAEFCVMPKYRRSGVGKKAVLDIFEALHGKWYLKMHPHNVGAARFWNNVIAEYTNNNYILRQGVAGLEFDDGTPADVIFFENGERI